MSGSLTADMGYASLFSSLGGGLLDAVGTYSKDQSEKSILSYDATVARQRAGYDRFAAKQSLKQGQFAQQRVFARAAEIKGGEEAAFGANNVDMSSGTALRLLTSTDYMKALDANQAKYNAQMNAWGHRVQASNEIDQANLYGMEGSSINPGMDVATSLLGTASTVSRQWASMSAQGVFG